MKPTQEVLIVGGSLCGLTFALACAHRGIRSRILERANSQQRSGAALGVNRTLLLGTIGLSSRTSSGYFDFPVLTNNRNAVCWSEIHGWLREQVLRKNDITLIEGCSVQEVVQTPTRAIVVTADGKRIAAPLVVGADGYRSMVRAAINPETPHPEYAGYVLWRGLVEERRMPASTIWPRDAGVALANTAGYRLVAYPVVGADGSLEHGQRRISFAWYDPARNAVLEELKCISRTQRVLGSLSREDVPAQVRAELRRLAERIWPSPWRNFIIHALTHRDVFATPVAEYVPNRLKRGQLAVIGDAARVVSPMTGMGFVAGTMDAGVLAECLGGMEDRSIPSISLALNRFEEARLKASQELAKTSIAWSRAYLENVGFRRTGQSWPLRGL